MKKSKFTEAQIVFAIKQSESGTPTAEICRKMGISEATFYKKPPSITGRRNTEAWASMSFEGSSSWKRKIPN